MKLRWRRTESRDNEREAAVASSLLGGLQQIEVLNKARAHWIAEQAGEARNMQHSCRCLQLGGNRTNKELSFVCSVYLQRYVASVHCHMRVVEKRERNTRSSPGMFLLSLPVSQYIAAIALEKT
jgi:hypothetical protein